MAQLKKSSFSIFDMKDSGVSRHTISPEIGSVCDGVRGKAVSKSSFVAK